jgi:hypothetical protein
VPEGPIVPGLERSSVGSRITVRRDKCRSVQDLTLDEFFRRSVFRIDEDNVFGVASWSVYGEDNEGFFEKFAGPVNGAFLEEDELSRAEFERRVVSEEEARST